MTVDHPACHALPQARARARASSSWGSCTNTDECCWCPVLTFKTSSLVGRGEAMKAESMCTALRSVALPPSITYRNFAVCFYHLAGYSPLSSIRVRTPFVLATPGRRCGQRQAASSASRAVRGTRSDDGGPVPADRGDFRHPVTFCCDF
eukprot:scaffold130716_cov33-Phaeocystis_antarctica.AAC.1